MGLITSLALCSGGTSNIRRLTIRRKVEMLAVIFEVYPTETGKGEYLSIAASLREFLKDRPGFISIERFQNIGDENKMLSLSFWEN